MSSKSVTHPTNRLDVISSGAEFLAKAFDVCVDRTRRDVALNSPDVVEQRLARLHAPFSADEGGEQSKLERGELALFFRHPNAMCLGVHAQYAEHERAGRFG